MPTVQAKFMHLEGEDANTATYLLIDYTNEDDLNSKISTLESEQQQAQYSVDNPYQIYIH